MKNRLFFLLLLFAGLCLKAEEKRIITSDGVELYVNVRGKGTPCLFLHGGPGSGSHWVEQYYGDYLEKNFTMIYIDQRGVGRSGSPKDANYSMKRMAMDFEEVRKALGFDKWLTMGHSFGGILQMGYIEEFPESHKGMLMVNCTLSLKESFCQSWSPKAAEFLGLSDIPECTNENSQIMDTLHSLMYRLREKDLFWKMAYEDKKYNAILDATYEEIPNFNGNFGNAAFSHEDYWQNFKALAGKHEVPVLFFYGKQDWMVGPDHYKDLLFPNLMLWANEGGHMPFFENKEDLQKAIQAYSEKYNF